MIDNKNKWIPILDCLNMSDTSLYDTLATYAECCSEIENKKHIHINMNWHPTEEEKINMSSSDLSSDKLYLAIGLRILSKLDLTNKKLIVDTENKSYIGLDGIFYKIRYRMLVQ